MAPTIFPKPRTLILSTGSYFRGSEVVSGESRPAWGGAAAKGPPQVIQLVLALYVMKGAEQQAISVTHDLHECYSERESCGGASHLRLNVCVQLFPGVRGVFQALWYGSSR